MWASMKNTTVGILGCILALVSMTMLSGCEDDVATDATKPPSSEAQNGFFDWEKPQEAGSVATHTIRIEGCEYLVYGSGRDRMMTHKGNCDNPIHRYNQVPTPQPAPTPPALNN